MTAIVLAALLAPEGNMPQAEYHVPRNWDEDTSLAIKSVEVPQDRVALVVDSEGKLDLLVEGGPSVSLVNGGKVVLKFTSCDGCLPMYREAKDSKGNWRPIEWLAISQCGNSYDAATLKTGRLWAWPIGTESGSFKTEVRFTIKIGSKKIVSNPYKDSIDPNMFSLDPSLKGSRFLKVGG